MRVDRLVPRLSINHALQVGSWWPASAQDAIFAGGDFRCGSVAAPRRRDEGRRRLADRRPGRVRVGLAVRDALPRAGPRAAARGPPKLLAFVAPRSEWAMLDDWATSRPEGQGLAQPALRRLPHPVRLGDRGQHDRRRRRGGTPGSALHGNPMYAGAGWRFTMSLAAVMVGGLYNALTSTSGSCARRRRPRHRSSHVSRTGVLPALVRRARTRAAMLEAALHDSAAQRMELCRRTVEDGVARPTPTTCPRGDRARVMIGAWDVMQADISQTVGASAATTTRVTRVFRDIALAIAHHNPQQRGFLYGEIGRGRSASRRSASADRRSPACRRRCCVPR